MAPAPEIRPPRYARRGALAALVTVVAGPLAGSVLFWTAMSLLNVGDAKTLLSALQQLAMGPVMGVMVAPIAYVIAAPPAIVAAGAVGWVVWRHGTISYLAAVLVAAVSCLAIAPFELIEQASSSDGWQRVRTLLVMFGPVAIVTALVLRYLTGRIGMLPKPARNGPPPPPERKPVQP